MLNMIRMNLYRFFTTKSVYVILGITFLLIMFVTRLEMSENDPVDATVMEEYGDFEEQSIRGFGMTIPVTEERAVIGDQLYKDAVCSGLLAVMIGIFVSIYTGKERERGFLKNLNTCVKNRYTIFLAKIVPMFLFVVFEMLVTFIAIGCNLSYENLPQLLAFMLAQTATHTAYAAGILLVGELLRNQAMTLLVAIFTALGVGSMILSLIESKLAQTGFPQGLLLGKYTAVMQINSIHGFQVIMFVAAVILALLYLLAGAVVSEKRDLY